MAELPSQPGPAVGIDDLNIDGGTLAIDSSAIARGRGFSDREVEAVGFERRSVVPPYEDAVTLAVNAARPVVEAAGRGDFELLIVATESGMDYGKPLSSYVHRYLGLPTRCRNVELKHACYAGTAALQLAASWVRSGAAPGRKALVVMTDIARRHFGDPAELTAGSGAVAVSVAADAGVLLLEPFAGYACREVYDVARPLATGEFGDPVLSLAAYLDLIEEAWAAYRCAATVTTPLDERFRYMLYHTPLESLVRAAHRALLEADHEAVTPGDAGASFERMVAPALGHARQLGNIYSGSVYCLLAGLLEGIGELADGTRIGICSYGSGSCAEIYGGVIAGGARERVRRHRMGAQLAARASLTLAEYERVFSEAEAMQGARDYTPNRDILPDHFERRYTDSDRLVLLRIENHHRLYGGPADLR